MTVPFESDKTSLTQSFRYNSASHSYTIKWRSLGDPNSPPLIFIHGTPWSALLWTPFALSLSRQFHVYLFDRPGFGDSPAELKLANQAADVDANTNANANTHADQVVELDGNLARQAEAFAALFKSWQKDWGDHQRAHVIAHDNGGLVSLRALLLHGCQYASLCLIDVVAIGPFGKPLFKAIGDAPWHFERLPDMAFEGILESYIRNAAFSSLSPDVMQMLKSPWLRDGGKERFIRELCQANVRSTEEVEGRYGEVGDKLPVKIIWGAEDTWIPVETASRLGEAIKAREVVVIEKAGHLLMYDQGAQLGVELGRWLSTV